MRMSGSRSMLSQSTKQKGHDTVVMPFLFQSTANRDGYTLFGRPPARNSGLAISFCFKVAHALRSVATMLRGR